MSHLRTVKVMEYGTETQSHQFEMREKISLHAIVQKKNLIALLSVF